MVAVFDSADEGVLLIDEAYSLARGGERDFGREAIDTIVKLIEDRRDRIVVIMAGYTDEMAELVATNPGIRSRFPRTLHFPDYTTDELLAIIDTMGDKGGYRLDEGARDKAAGMARRGTSRQGIRQRPDRPQPLRVGGGHPGQPPRLPPRADRRAAHDAHRRRSARTRRRPVPRRRFRQHGSVLAWLRWSAARSGTGSSRPR